MEQGNLNCSRTREAYADVSDESLGDFLFAAPSLEFNGKSKGRNVSTKKNEKISGILIGKLTGWNAAGQPLVGFVDSPQDSELPAQTTVQWIETDIGKDVVLMFERGNPRKPVILGFLQDRKQERVSPQHLELEMDGERIVLKAKNEITLRCGRASLTLTRAGKVLLKGAYVSSRSSGVNRIKGGSVQIN